MGENFIMRVIFILILFLFVNCNQVKEKSGFFENCDVSVIDLSEGLTIGKVNGDSMQLFHVLQTNYTDEWNWEEEIKNVERDFNIVDEGFVNLNNKKRPYHLVKQGNDQEWFTLYVTVLDTIQKRNYTLSISTHVSADYNKRFCELKPIMESFKIL